MNKHEIVKILQKNPGIRKHIKLTLTHEEWMFLNSQSKKQSKNKSRLIEEAIRFYRQNFYNKELS